MIYRLSDFKDEDAIRVVGELLVPIGNIVTNSINAGAKDKGALSFASSIFTNNTKDTLAMLAILSKTPSEEYSCTGATVLSDVIYMLSDPDLLQLFGLRSQTSTSAGSASLTSEVAAE